ncbi:TOX3 family protein [Megaselia abdita]
MIDYSPSGSTTSGDYHSSVVNKTPEHSSSSSPSKPVKPISPYASFFRDTVSSIQGQNPDISFQEISKIVNSMWEALPTSNKKTYKKRHEEELREYDRALTEYKSKSEDEDNVVTISPQVYTPEIPVAKVAPLPVTATTTAPADPTNLVTTNGDSTEDILSILSANICIRDGCGSNATTNPDWDGEYCSYDCVVIHTKTVFNKWVQGNQLTNACT